MTVNYNNFASKFAQSRKNMSWPELEYFFSFLGGNEKILDIGCGSGRLLQQYHSFFGNFPKEYLGIDLSENLLLEARKQYPNQSFKCGNMLDIDSLGETQYDAIFLVASFHHLSDFTQRDSMMKKLYDLLNPDGIIFMTNWNLMSEQNYKKYAESEIADSTNNFGSKDFNIKFGESDRYYHSFALSELELLAQKNMFVISENKVFEGEKNIITILKK